MHGDVWNETGSGIANAEVGCTIGNTVSIKKGKNNIVLKVYEDLKYENCKIPMFIQILQLFKEKMLRWR